MSFFRKITQTYRHTPPPPHSIPPPSRPPKRGRGASPSLSLRGEGGGRGWGEVHGGEGAYIYTSVRNNNKDRNNNREVVSTLKFQYSLKFPDFSKNFGLKNFGFTEVFGGPEGFRKLREACRKNFHQVSSKSELVRPTNKEKDKKINDF